MLVHKILLLLEKQEFWSLRGQNTARKIVHDCVVSFKNKPKVIDEGMLSLPTEHVTHRLPFNCVSTDFYGHFFITYKYQLKGTLHKYIIFDMFSHPCYPFRNRFRLNDKLFYCIF